MNDVNVNLVSDQYCLFFIDSWITCSTKAEWASWVQAIVVTLALVAPLIKLISNQIKFYTLFFLSVDDIRSYAVEIENIFHSLEQQDYCPDRNEYVNHLRKILKINNPLRDLIDSADSATPKIIYKTNSLIEDLRQYLINIESFISSMSDEDIYNGPYEEILESIRHRLENIKIYSKKLISFGDMIKMYNLMFRFFIK